MPSIGYLLGDSAFDATVKSLKNGKGFGFIGNIGGGLLKSAGSLALGTAELTGKGVMSGTGTVGKGLINSFKGNPYAVIGSALTGMAAGHIVADMDGQADTTKTMAHGALYATGASALGGAALVSGFGAAALGAGMTGVNALGAVGSHFVTAKTKGEKYNEVVKNFKREEAWTDTQYKEKLASEVEKVGAKVGSKEAMDIGLGN
jgi:hypothetical protein